MDFSELLYQLRRSRRLTQEALAAAAGVSSATIYRLERGETPNRSTATAIFSALERLAEPALTEAERSAFLRGTGLDRILSAIQPSIEKVLPLRSFTAALPPDQARVYWVVADLMDRAGPARVLQMLEAVASMAGIDIEPPVPGDSQGQFINATIAFKNPVTQQPDPGAVRRVVKPPVQRDGYVEQEIVEYGPADAPPAVKEQPSPPKKKRRSS